MDGGADDADPQAPLRARPCCSPTSATTTPTADVWDLCNSGQHATWFAARSDDPAENLRHVHLYPEDFYFPAGGASVHHLAAPRRVHVRPAHRAPTAATGCRSLRGAPGAVRRRRRTSG